ncbi:glycosyltransferase family 4 protein [Sphaerospermopsis aphanizomenoides BCCUSP55]|uniref:glycosyltransferase family 4 protein n=1 Tax=Sphaerospermopsis aphanizomenoides TaxID=459663 RepID=UPI001F2F5C04|nr:glycosyltransferase family 4 protein [Sphaerospermopsis aphanizomenoides]MBK1988972.1 glycosyltransferase family 4 protein [Sphaerospermopsis aphanizomenoides BCCUSP55]
MITISCNAPYGVGGLGQHLKNLVDDAISQDILSCYYASPPTSGKPEERLVSSPIIAPIFKYTPIRFSPGWKSYLNFEIFDRLVSHQLQPGQVFLGFNGQSLNSFYRASKLKYQQLSLVSANSHVNNVIRKHREAISKYPFEETWLNEIQCQKNIQEYQMSDTIYYASEYIRQSFLTAGVPAQKLVQCCCYPHPRFQPSTDYPNDGIFRIVYTGSLSVMKGIPVLMEAFSKLTGNVELTLVGGSSTRGMRIYLENCLRQDSRIKIIPGDPLPHLQKADVYVHPSYEDGYAYASVEALACKIPVIVTEDTGMKEYVQEGINGYVVPTGDWEAILERLEHIRRFPLRESAYLPLINTGTQF